MKISKKRIVRYLYDHVDEEMNTYDLISDCYENIDQNADWMEIDEEVRRIAENNGFILDSSEYDGMLIGLPYNIDFVIRGPLNMFMEDRTDYQDILKRIAEKEVRTMSDEDREFYLQHPDYNELHFDYGMYLRNRYIHGKRKGKCPDKVSEDIFNRIIELLSRQK